MFELEIDGVRLNQSVALGTFPEAMQWVVIAIAHGAKSVIIFNGNTFMFSFKGAL